MNHKHIKGPGQVSRVPFHLDSKCYIKVQKRAKKQGCSFDEFLASFFVSSGVDAMPVASIVSRRGART